MRAPVSALLLALLLVVASLKLLLGFEPQDPRVAHALAKSLFVRGEGYAEGVILGHSIRKYVSIAQINDGQYSQLALIARKIGCGYYLARRERLVRDERLERFMIASLNEGWAPEQIGGRRGLPTAALAGMDRGRQRAGPAGLGTETIYRFIHRARQKVEKPWRLLPRDKARRGRRKRREINSSITDRRLLQATWRSTTDAKRSKIARSPVIGRPN